MISRQLESQILDLLNHTPSVVLIGPRQIGKTTLAFIIQETLSAVYLDFENPTDLRKAQNFEAFYRENSNKLIILDEIQRLPGLFLKIRGLIDAKRREGNKFGHFLFLGSASLDLLRQSSESLAGRISYTELASVNIVEFADKSNELDKLSKLWLRGGFPESLLSKNDENSLSWRKDFIRTYLERDIPQLGTRIPAETLRRLWVMLAHSQGSNINASKLAGSLEVSNVTVGRYIDLLVDLLLVRRLEPYTSNIKKRLVKSPRLYVRDSGITHALLNIQSYNDLLGHPVVGKSWEGFIIENICSVIPSEVNTYYYRTAGGAEIDLVLEVSPKEFWAIEIKRSSGAKLNKGFFEACSDLKPSRKFVIHSDKDSFYVENDIRETSLYEFLELLKDPVSLRT